MQHYKSQTRSRNFEILNFERRFRDEATTVSLWYPDTGLVKDIPRQLAPHMEATAYLSTKQVASACMLRHSGSVSVTKNRDVLRRVGFPLNVVGDFAKTQEIPTENLEEIYPDDSVSNVSSSYEESETGFTTEYYVDNEAEEEEKGDEPISSSNAERGKQYRIQYSDPWKTFAAMELCRRNGVTQPRALVWGGDGYRIQDPLPVSMFGSRWTGGRRKTRFSDLYEHEIQMYVVLHKTHWGNFLRESSQKGSVCEHRHFCRRLRDKISSFLKGHTHPDLTPEGAEFYFGPKYVPRSRKIRSQRLIEVLKTIDGMFLQRYLSTLSEEWTWRKYDMFVLWNLHHLIDDEFYDGPLANLPEKSMLAYNQLKASRKLFKRCGPKCSTRAAPAIVERTDLI